MTTNESKGRFFTKRIDSHNESNRFANWNALLYIDYGTQNLNKKTLEKRMYINGCGMRITNC